jgi:hypothetical protein
MLCTSQMSSMSCEAVPLNTSQRMNNSWLDDIDCTIVIESGSCKRIGGYCGKLAATEVTGSDEITDQPGLEADSPTKVSCTMTVLSVTPQQHRTKRSSFMCALRTLHNVTVAHTIAHFPLNIFTIVCMCRDSDWLRAGRPRGSEFESRIFSSPRRPDRL